ncbi:hypothetical protein SO802_013867 [Lithocarpus litseifolius]|uniref:ADP-ribosyl cyclase/cyclic ADP-ribose hydrolase n=1 Tax=Lithocarpus litseifolius TaxID=425828 RepID=A0AAW2DCB1_9ROSI
MEFGTGSTSLSFPSSTFGYTYDVFLSFRGEDTRNNFVGHLYTALDNKGIHTFKDDEKLQRGTIIKSELFKAIEESRFAVVILSKDYASSSWCLIELAKIIECMKKTGLTVLPVFHYVDPSDMRHLDGVFEMAFAEHSVRFEDKIDEVNNWKDALVKVANIAGWDLSHRSEAPVIEEIVRKIYGQLNSIYSNVHEDCVGLDSRMTEITYSYLGIGLEDVRFIGIWGMGGMGKTTLARVLHQRIHYLFDASSFIGNVREESCKNGLISLQKQILDDILIENNIRIRDIQWGINMIKDRLHKKKVLIILDDVDQLEQLEALAGKRDWFGPGSRIIITTRDQRLLITHDMTEAEIYKVKKLEDYEALELFSREVFKKDYPPEDFKELSANVIHYAGGLPLTLKVLGASLMKRELVVWEHILAKLKENPPEKFMNAFAISYNGLDSKEKNLFLDIACFFKGKNKGWVASILQISIEIDSLKEKSLINISRFGKLWMHDTLQDFGREIVRRESLYELGQQSRLWLSNDIFHVLKHNIGTQKVKGIFLSSSFLEEKEQLKAEVFSKMINLRLLQINHVHLPQGLDYLSNELCFMNWEKYPLESLPESFHPNKLIELIMCASSLKQLWKGIKDLIMIPDTTEIPNLESLILKDCTSLSKIHPSLGYLKKLIFLNLDGCVCLESLPCMISLESLEILVLNGCLRLKKFPEIVGNMSPLPHLVLAGTAIEGLPLSIKYLTGLTLLNLRDCKSLLSLPDSICCMTSLKTLTLSGCSRLNKLPTNLGNLECLENLEVIGIAIRELPSSVERLTSLTSLNLSDCKDLLSLPDTICSVTNLKALTLSGCSSLDRLPKKLGNLTGLKELEVNKTAIRELPSSLEHLSNLTSLSLSDCKELLSIPNVICNMTNIETLTLSGCSKLEDLPKYIGNHIGLKKLEIIGTAMKEPPSSIFLIKNLEVLRFHGCEGTSCKQSPNPVRWELPPLSCLRSLVKLELRDCNLQAVPNDIDGLHLLEGLNLSENNFVCLPESIVRLSKLKVIYIENCTSLRSLPQIPLSTLSIWANGCTSLETLPNQLKQESFFEPNVYLLNCFKLADNQGFSDKFLTLLSCYFQELCYNDFSGTNRYDLVVPGRKFPKWFSHQSEGDSVTLQVPPNFGEKCLAIGLCAAFEHLPSGVGALFGSGSHDRTRHMLFCYIPFYSLHSKSKHDRFTDRLTDRFAAFDDSECISFPFPENFGHVESRHLWLIYLRREFFREDRVYGSVLQIKFETEGTGLTVKKCGAHLVYKQDIERLSQTNEMDYDSYDNHLNSAVPADGTSRVEPSHDDNYDGAGPGGQGSSNVGVVGHSGEGSSNGTTGTKRKRMEPPNIVEKSMENWFRNLRRR